jgi:TetR/AcrR family transcriptional regulator
MSSEFRPVNGARSILDAAFALFLRDGYEGVSVAKIAEQAQVSKANVFHHFESKEALYLDVMREASIGHAEFAERLLEENISSVEKIRRLAIWEFEDNFRNNARVHLLISEVFGGRNTPSRKLARQVFRRNFDAVIGLFEQGQRGGEFRPDFDPAVAACMLGSTSSMYAQTHEGMRQLPKFRYIDDPRAYANATCDLLLSAISQSRPAPQSRRSARSRPSTAARSAPARVKNTRSLKQ